jgi:hypothetical protein
MVDLSMASNNINSLILENVELKGKLERQGLEYTKLKNMNDDLSQALETQVLVNRVLKEDNEEIRKHKYNEVIIGVSAATLFSFVMARWRNKP